jgi:MFS family permease
MKDPRSCSKCGYAASDDRTRCPECGGWMRGAQRIRRLGWLLLVLGLFLVGMMVTITVLVAPMMLYPGAAVEGSRFTGSPEQAFLVLGMFGIVIVFGLACIANGLWQIATGRRNIWIVIAILLITFLLLAIAGGVRKALDKGDKVTVPSR